MINKMVVMMIMAGLIAAGGCTTDWFNPSADNNLRMSVQEFVKLRFVDRWPVVEAYQYGSNASVRSSVVKTLEDILKDSSQKSAWAHSVATLGFVGGDKAKRVIFNFIERLQALTSFSLYEQRAMHSGVVALGTWVWTSKYRPDLAFGGAKVKPAILALEKYVKKCGNFSSHTLHTMMAPARSAAMETLEGTRKDSSQKLAPAQPGPALTIICPIVPDSVLKREIAQAGLWGLALSGDKLAGMILQEFAGATDGNAAVKSFIPEAQVAHAMIKRVGLLCYYEPYSLECQQMAGRL